MHEFSIASSIVEVVREEATDHGADRVESITVAVGEASHVNREQLETCLEVAREDTIAADATVDIESVEPYGSCSCGWAGHPDASDRALAYAPDLRCPECEARIDLERGDGCRVMELTVPDESTVAESEEADS
ncbi:MAG: hydrogenase maturation nickel metallochaperone HypA [Halococcoides sp.]